MQRVRPSAGACVWRGCKKQEVGLPSHAPVPKVCRHLLQLLGQHEAGSAPEWEAQHRKQDGWRGPRNGEVVWESAEKRRAQSGLAQAHQVAKKSMMRGRSRSAMICSSCVCESGSEWRAVRSRGSLHAKPPEVEQHHGLYCVPHTRTSSAFTFCTRPAHTMCALAATRVGLRPGRAAPRVTGTRARLLSPLLTRGSAHPRRVTDIGLGTAGNTLLEVHRTRGRAGRASHVIRREPLARCARRRCSVVAWSQNMPQCGGELPRADGVATVGKDCAAQQAPRPHAAAACAASPPGSV